MLRLLDKKEIDQKKAIEEKRKQDEAVRLAKRINGLRELSAETESSYESYRTSTLKQVQAEIDGKIRERDELDAILPRLRKERERLEKPVDLVEAWGKVAADFEELKRQSGVLNRLRENLELRDSEASRKELDLSEKLAAVRDQEVLAGNHLDNARRKESVAAETLQEAQNKLLEADTDIKGRYTQLESKEAEIAKQSQAVFARENEIEKKEKQITSERRFLADQRATLERAMKRIQNGRQRSDR